MNDNPNRQSRAFLALPTPVIARFLAPGGAHVVVAGSVADDTLATRCEGCGGRRGPFVPIHGETGSSGAVHRALRDAQRHAETCRRIPLRLWPENAGGVQ